MALKYYFEFTDVKNILHRCEIYNDTFVGDSREVQGSLSLTKASTKDTLEAIRGGGLQIDLEANSLLSFNDLYSENEREYSVKYYRDSTLMFYGWLSPEGLIESFVEDKWVISLDCTDGLGFLNNLSYLNNSTGLTFTGKQSALEIIVNCLKRTNLEQNIYTSIDILHTGMSYGQNVLEETYFNANRFIKEDNNTTIMNCEEVLRSILEIFSCCITQYNGNWYIYKPNILFDYTSQYFFAYDSNGVALTTPNITVEFSQNLGSQINNFYPHHVNKNQQLTVDSSIGAYRINYKHGLVKDLFINTILESDTSISPPQVDEWTINDINLINFPSDNRGFLLEGDTRGQNDLIITSDSSLIGQNNSLIHKGSISWFSPSPIPINQGYAEFICKVVLTDGSDTYYLDNNGNWNNSSTLIRFRSLRFKEIFSYEIKSDLAPIQGDVYIELYTPRPISFGTDYFVQYKVIESTLVPTAELGNVKGENYTFQIIDKPSTKIEKTKEVLNGDTPSDFYIGTIYEGDQTTPTEYWYRNEPISHFKPILQIMGEERMKMYAKPLRVFSGEVFGFIDYLSVISIDGIDNVLFMPIEYDYNAETNITKLKLKQILNNSLPDSVQSGIDYELTLDYGNVVEPTIKG
jgi:hypothetical protein